MTDRAAIAARTLDRVQFITGAAPDELALDKPLKGQRASSGEIDSLDVVEIVMSVEEEFALLGGDLDEGVDWTIDSITDAVIRAKGGTA